MLTSAKTIAASLFYGRLLLLLYTVFGYSVFSISLTTGLIGNHAAAAETKHVLIVVGPSTHPPGTHEVAAGARLIQGMLSSVESLPELEINIVEGWPSDQALLLTADTIVFTGDTFPPARLPEKQAILSQLEQLMNNGCGMVCIHYATGLWGQDVPADGDHPMLRWLGGYFANKTCPHHQGIARVYQAATVTPSAEHPLCRGWQAFTLHDEPYINNYFGKNNNQPADNVTILATSMLPPEAPKAEPVAWCVQRDDSGRGFSIVMPHFYKNWEDDDLRCFILNGIVWSAGIEVPEQGIQTKKPELSRYLNANATP